MEKPWVVLWLMGLTVLAFAATGRASQEALPQSTSREAESAGGSEEGSDLEAQPLLPSPGATTVSLAQAVATALEHNFGQLAAADGLESTRLRTDAARAQFLPKLTPRYQRAEDLQTLSLDASQKLPWSGASLTATGTYIAFPDSRAPATRSAATRLTLTQPLLRGFGPNATYFDLRNARRALVSQERSFARGRLQLAVQVASAFYQVIQQRALFEVARQSLSSSEGLQRASQARLEVGLVSKLDVFRAELQASQTEDAMVRTEAALESALERFRSLLGLGPTEPLEPEGVALRVAPGDALEPLAVLVSRALQNRLEIAEARDQIDDARRAAALAKQNLLPQLDVNLSLVEGGLGPSFGSAFHAGDRALIFSLTTSYPLDRAGDLASKAVAELEVAGRARALRQLELDVEAEVRAAARDLLSIRKSVELQSKSVEVARQQRRLATLRYQRGLASNFDVVDAEGRLLLARSSLVGLLTSYQVARAELQRLTGTLDVEHAFAGAPAVAQP